MKKVLFLWSVLLVLQSLRAQNVGIGTTTPVNGKLEIISGSNQLVSRTSATGSGFSLFGNNLGFNTMSNGGFSFMGAGYGSFFQFTPADGKLRYFSSLTNGTANTLMGSTTSTLFSINSNGNVGIGPVDAAEGLHLENRNIRLDDASGNRSVLLTANGNANAGSLSLYYDDGTENIAIRASDGVNQSGEIIFRKPGVSGTTLEIDGDYASTGRSRIIVDEIQIKGGADFAEYFDVSANGVKPEAGMLVCINEKAEGTLTVSRNAYDKKVAGVISGANGISAGMMMGHKGTIADGKQPVAISGRVYVKAIAGKTAITPGDLLTTSNTPGHAMRASDAKKGRGAIIGKAMGRIKPWTSGYLLVLLSIQ